MKHINRNVFCTGILFQVVVLTYQSNLFHYEQYLEGSFNYNLDKTPKSHARLASAHRSITMTKGPLECGLFCLKNNLTCVMGVYNSSDNNCQLSCNVGFFGFDDSPGSHLIIKTPRTYVHTSWFHISDGMEVGKSWHIYGTPNHAVGFGFNFWNNDGTTMPLHLNYRFSQNQVIWDTGSGANFVVSNWHKFTSLHSGVGVSYDEYLYLEIYIAESSYQIYLNGKFKYNLIKRVSQWPDIKWLQIDGFTPKHICYI